MIATGSGPSWLKVRRVCLLRVAWKWMPSGQQVYKYLPFLSRSFAEFMRDTPAQSSALNPFLFPATLYSQTPRDPSARGLYWAPFPLPGGPLGGSTLREPLPLPSECSTGQRKSSLSAAPTNEWSAHFRAAAALSAATNQGNWSTPGLHL